MFMELSSLQWLVPLQYMQVIWPAILVLFASLFLPRFYKAFLVYRHVNQIPGPSFFFTNMFLIKMARKGTTTIDLFNLFCALPCLFPKSDVIRIWMGWKRAVVPCTPELAEIVLTREESLDRPPEVRFLSPFTIGNTLITASPVQKWRKRRKLLNPAFHIRIIEQYLQVFNKYAAIIVEEVKQRDPIQPIDLLPEMQKCTMDIICEAAMGVDIESRKGNNTEFVDAFHNIAKICSQRVGQPWLHPDIIFKYLPIGRRLKKNVNIFNQTSIKIIAEKKARMLSDPTKKQQIEENFVDGAKQMQVAFIDLLLYQHLYGAERLSEEDIVGDVNTFIFAGFDTCSLTLSWALYLIGNDPRVQQAIQDELNAVLSNDRDRPISAFDIKNLKYLNCVFKETLRLYPPGSTVFRYTQKDLHLKEYNVPAGTVCLVLVDLFHRNPRYFPKPHSFFPERFMNKNEDKHSFTYIPFAAGPKNCIGQKFAHFEVMSVLASILRNFSVKSANTRDNVRRALELTITPIDPLLVYMTPRQP